VTPDLPCHRLEFQQFAVHSWFSGVDRGTHPNFTHNYTLPLKRGWAWEIPITDEITSIGVVTDRANFPKSGEDVDAFFHEAIKTNPKLAERIQQAERVREFRMDGNYSYHMDRYAGDGWLLVGDAAFFVDPIFSSGVSMAMHSSKFAAETILNALKTGDVSEKGLGAYHERMKVCESRWRKLVRLFYQAPSAFPRVVADSTSRTQVLRLCEGEVYEEAAAETLLVVEKEMEKIRNTDHPLHRYLSA
jgi:1H-pyrrole-2-carbonyl-[peptidyl-carrier protein] chlorinase